MVQKSLLYALCASVVAAAVAVAFLLNRHPVASVVMITLCVAVLTGTVIYAVTVRSGRV